MKVYVCDLCGKEVLRGRDGAVNIKFKAKQYRGGRVGEFRDYGWFRVDLCDYCKKQLIEASLTERKVQDG